MGNIIISNPQILRKKLQKIYDKGKDNFHVLADFDRTLTKGFVQGQISPSVIAQIRNGNYLASEYAPAAYALFDHYNKIERDPDIPKAEKIIQMDEWRKKHFDLLIRSGLDKNVLENIVSTKTLQFRDGSRDFFDVLNKKHIPLVIVSASVGDMINLYLKQEGKLYPNINLVSNLFIFDKNGKVVDIQKPIIHCMNKSEIMLNQFPFFEEIKHRKNVLLLGDSIEDIGMIEGFDYDTLLTVGFCHYPENIDEYRKHFDIVIINDESMDYINNIIQKIP